MEEQRQFDHRDGSRPEQLDPGGIAHEFRNLLVGIMGNLELTLMRLDPSDAARPRLEQAYQAACRAAELAGQLLASSGRGRVPGAGPAPPNAAAGDDR